MEVTKGNTKAMNIKANGHKSHKLKRVSHSDMSGEVIESYGSQREDIKSKISKWFQTLEGFKTFETQLNK